MIEFYPQIKSVHIACVIASGLLFALRGGLMLSEVSGYNHIALRALSWAIDTSLLTVALMLMSILHQYPFVHAWLTVKVLLLVVYIVLGSLALKPGLSLRTRTIYFAAALLVYLSIVSVARTHDPLGMFHPLLS